ncbi:MAG: twin-arginine translocase subunit TatC [SAR324 cluster bacterium]|nr:twin-arginine translocase subunit TatC [SAR324 cluster bacterium]
MSKNTPTTPENNESSMTLLSHIGELRTRLIRSTILLLVVFLTCFAFSEQLLELLSLPLRDSLYRLKISSELDSTKEDISENNIEQDKLTNNDPIPANQEILPAQYNCLCQESPSGSGSGLGTNSDTVSEFKQDILPQENSLNKPKKTLTQQTTNSSIIPTNPPDKSSPNQFPVTDKESALLLNNNLNINMPALTCRCQPTNQKNDSATINNVGQANIGQANIGQANVGQANVGQANVEQNKDDGLVEDNTEQESLVPFIFLGLTEVFIAKLKISFWVALFLMLPYLLAEIWGFVAPAMYKNEKKMFISIILGSIVCFLGGASFGYGVVFPLGFDFFLSLGGESLANPTISLENYLSFTLMLLLVFGFVFELPVVCLILAQFGVINAPMMLKYSRFVIVAIFFVSAIFSPPDPLSMLLMGFPLVVLYFFSYVLIGILKGFKLKEE